MNASELNIHQLQIALQHLQAEKQAIMTGNFDFNTRNVLISLNLQAQSQLISEMGRQIIAEQGIEIA